MAVSQLVGLICSRRLRAVLTVAAVWLSTVVVGAAFAPPAGAAVVPADVTAGDTATSTLVTSSANPSLTDQKVIFVAHVTEGGGSNVTGGTVTFTDGSTPIGEATEVSAGYASVSTTSLTEGVHTITASYSDSSGAFGPSTDSLSQYVDSPTVVSAGSYCNNGGISIGGTGTATPYPSNINITGTRGNISGLTVTLKGVTDSAPGDLDMLLVGPDGHKLVLVSDAGGTAAISGVDATFDDAAASFVPASASWGDGSQTYKPTDYNDGADTFPAPSPSGPSEPAPSGSATLAGTFDGVSANGLWSLYVVDDTPGNTGSLSGWCVTPTTPPTIHVPGDITVTEDSPGAGASVTFSVTADGNPAATIGCVEGARTVQSGDTFAVGVHTIDCTASNSAGEDYGSFTITVNAGQTAPTIHVPGDITVTEDSPGAGASVTFTVTADGSPAATIACLDGARTVQSGDTFAVGTHTIDCTATNSAGTDSGSFTITVNPATIVSPAQIAPKGGDNQATLTGTAFPTDLSAIVTAAGLPVPGSSVTFTVLPGSTSTSGTASFDGSATATAQTDATGVATAPTLTAGATPGPVVVTATVASGASAVFTETVIAPGPARADLVVHLHAPTGFTVGHPGTVTVTVTNRGPSTAAKVMTDLVLPRGFSFANAGGGEVQGSAALFSAAALRSGRTLTYRLSVVSHVKGRATLVAGTLSGTRDPIYRNNSTRTATKTT